MFRPLRIRKSNVKGSDVIAMFKQERFISIPICIMMSGLGNFMVLSSFDVFF